MTSCPESVSIKRYLHPDGSTLRTNRTRVQTRSVIVLTSEPRSADGKLAEVELSAADEIEFDLMSDTDFGTLSDGQSSVMMKPAGQSRTRPGHLPQSLTRNVARPSGGQPLPDAIRIRMEKRLGLDLSGIRVHHDAMARTMALQINARAFAYGRHIWLRSAGDIHDSRLIAHEAAHCIQQGAARPIASAQPAARAPPVGRQADADHRPRAPPALRHQRPAAIRRLAEPEQDNGILARGAESLADRSDSYGLLKVLIGRRLFTGETVRQDAMSYVGAFMRFVGADETFDQMRQSGSLERGFQTIREGAVRHDLTWSRVKTTFEQAYDAFEWTAPVESLTRIFGPFFADVLAFGGLVLKTVAELVAEAFVIGFGPMGREVWAKIKAIGEVIGLVLENPFGFAMNLLRSVALGIEGFGSRILTHIKKGLLAWVLGPFAAMGVTLPETLDLKGIINVLLQVLGLTYPQLRPRLIRKLNPHGELKVTAVEKLIEVVNILRTEGLAGVWRKFLDYVDNLQMTVINGIRDWVIQAVITAGIRKLVAWSNPAGALLDVLFTIYKLIVFFVEKFEQILSFATSVFDSIGKIARGQLNDAARAIEDTLALTIPIMISFLTNLLGLPDIAGAVRRIITNLRARVHAAFDKLLDFIINKIKKLIARLIEGFRARSGVAEQQVNMQGTMHRLAYELTGRRYELFMHSKKKKTDAATLQKTSADIGKTCSRKHLETTQKKLEEAVPLLKEDEAKNTALAAKPKNQAETPQEHARRQAVLARVAPLLEAATRKENAATEAVASGSVDIDAQPAANEVAPGTTLPPEQKTTVEIDMEDMHFRYVIVPDNIAVEGAWGPWNGMIGLREAFKKEMKDNKLDGRYNIDLDHNPEYQILWRLGHLEYRNHQRDEGADKTLKGRIYPSVSAFYNNADLASGAKRDRKDSDKDFAMAIRYDAHRTLPDTQAANVAEFKTLCEYSKKQLAFVPKKGKTAEVLAKTWAPQIRTSAEAHQAEVASSYTQMKTDRFVSESAVTQIEKSGGQMIGAADQILSGEKPDTQEQEMAPGHISGIGMKPDPVDAELLTDSYSKLGKKIAKAAPRYGHVFDKHHLIEDDILEKVGGRFKGVRLLNALLDPKATVAGLELSGDSLGDVAKDSIGTLQKDIPALSGSSVADEVTEMTKKNGFAVHSVFSNKAVKSNGFAISVLKKVNNVLGRQAVTNIDTAVEATLRQSLETRADAARNAVRSAYSAVRIDETEAEDVARAKLRDATKAARRGILDQANATFASDLRTALAGTLDQLTENAHADFVAQMGASLRQTYPANGNFPPGSEALDVLDGLMTRYQSGPGNLLHVQQENRKRWLA